MAQLEVADFIKPKNLTERAYSIANSMWPRIESYIAQRGGVISYLKQLEPTSNGRSDFILAKALKTHFSQLLHPAGFFLKDFNLVYELTNDNTYGVVNSFLMVKSNGTAKIPIVVFDLCVCNIFEISEQEFLQVFFHELTHIEQAANLLLELTSEELLQALPENKPIFIERLERYFTTRNIDPSINDGEISSYARELALKIFYAYKVELKNMPSEDRHQFITKVIIPNYERHMSPAVKENVFDRLSNNSNKKFLRELVTQLYDFCDGLF